MIVDANMLLYARNSSEPYHEAAKRWLEGVLSGPLRVGLPWESLVAFVRIGTNPRVFPDPLHPVDAWRQVDAWLSRRVAWIPGPTADHAVIFGELVQRYRLAGPQVSDAHFAAIALGHGLTVMSTDSDFARFEEVSWENPIR